MSLLNSGEQRYIKAINNNNNNSRAKTDRQAGRRTGAHETDTQTVSQTDRHTDSQTGRHGQRETVRQSHRETYRGRDR